MQIGERETVHAERSDRGNFRTHAIFQLYGGGPAIERQVKSPQPDDINDI